MRFASLLDTLLHKPLDDLSPGELRGLYGLASSGRSGRNRGVGGVSDRTGQRPEIAQLQPAQAMSMGPVGWVAEVLGEELWSAQKRIVEDPRRARRIGQEWRIRRHKTGDWPSLKTVINRFGRLSEAIAEAGLAPREAKSGRTNREAAQYHAFTHPLDGAVGEGHRRNRLARSVWEVAEAER